MCGMDDALRIHTLTIDCDDAVRVARFWCSLLGYEVVPNHTDSIATASPTGSGPAMLFTWAGAPRSGENRLHLDLRPSDQAAAVERATELGARPADIGQSGDESWVVLEDPEGNVFCILQSDEDLRRWEASAPDPMASEAAE